VKDTSRGLPGPDEQPAIVRDTTRLAAIAQEPPRVALSSETTRMSSEELLRMEAVAKSPSTRPDLKGWSSRWVWGTAGAGVLLIVSAAVIFNSQRGAREVVVPTVVELPPIPSRAPTRVEPPVTDPGEPVQPKVPAAKSPTELSTPPRVRPPVRPPVPKQELPLVCEEKDWQAGLRTAIGQRQQAFLRKYGSAVPPDALKEIEAWDSKLSAATTTADCANIARGVDRWRKKQGL
jgi:hypothetical protein